MVCGNDDVGSCVQGFSRSYNAVEGVDVYLIDRGCNSKCEDHD